MDVAATEPVGGVLREARLAAGLTQEALAERAGVSVRNIQSLERGLNRPRWDTVQRLVAALGLEGAARAQVLAAATSAPRRRAGLPAIVADTPTAAASRSSNLPLPLTSFVGREHELAEVAGLLARTRLLTLTGTGGVGKTRLALRVAESLLDRNPQGVWLVELAPLADPTLVPGTVLAALGVPEQPGRPPLATLLDALRARHLLLVLDNCEHLLDVCAQLAEALLCACPHLRILATSREPLGVAGETRWRVPSLAVPGAGQAASPGAVARCAAVRLFVERARAVQPAFALSAANAAAVAEVCARLDGIPLALELAAARLSGLGVADLASRLDQRFRLLTGGSRTALPRQQTLRATVAWSYDLLTSQEQALFARLSVFAGGWSLEAAEAVGAGEAIAAEQVVELLVRLVDKSLVVAEQLDDGSVWYRLLETLRQYGRERLPRGEMPVVQRRHAAYYLALTERAERELNGPQQQRWLDRLEREHDNLRAALAWSLDPSAQAGESGLRLAGSLHFFWLFRDHHAEGLAWLERALAHAAEAQAPLRAKALCNAGVLAGLVNDLPRSHALLAQSVALSREARDWRQLSMALGVQGSTPWGSVQDEPAAAVLDESLSLARAVGEPWLVGQALLHSIFRVANSAAIERPEERARAWTAGAECLQLFQAVSDGITGAVTHLTLGQIALHEGDYPRARAAFAACLPILRAQGWRSTVADGLVGLADAAREQGDDREAATFYAEGLALYRQGGDLLAPAIPRVLCRLADLALEQGDWAAAQTRVRESLLIARDTGRVGASTIAGALEVQAALAAAQGAPVSAVRLAGAAAALRARSTRPAPDSEQGTLERRLTYLPPSPCSPEASEQASLELRLAPARQVLSAAEQASAWAAGQAMTREQAIAYALAQQPTEGGAPLLHLPPRQRDVTAAPARPRRSRAERLAWAVEHLRTAGPLSPRAYASAMAVSVDTALIDLRALLAQGIVRAEGTTKDRRYTLRADEESLPTAESSAVGAAAER